MDNDNNIPQRKSIRLKGYDYSNLGSYFITICTQDKKCLFGNISEKANLYLNSAGDMIGKLYFGLENKFRDIKCGTYIIMPNHFHCILNIITPDTIEAGQRVCLNDKNNNDLQNIVGADLCVCPEGKIVNDSGNHINEKGEHAGSPLQLSRVIQWFKTMTTNEYIRGVKTWGWEQFDKKLWQRNYFEHIIRNEKSYNKISDYIINNPINWIDDKYYL